LSSRRHSFGGTVEWLVSDDNDDNVDEEEDELQSSSSIIPMNDSAGIVATRHTTW
jgi:hypothetical protein